ncbi:FadR/GntR family transcriptional regulator [Sphingomonas sp. ASY06-1R]|jgi:GntR family transcriptional repressor for pyruvate dehydrogenase complex|uniref:FadR/GntR family transcriptional regulator n=1 Tax=Sphingomonas sp. ASY06-1R TaxID=3445771 RepID=UPI003FA26F68
MAKTEEAASPRLYESITRALEQAIEVGRYRPGDRLPSERELSDQFGVSRPVVREAIIVLELRGLVQRRHGAGVYVAPKASLQLSPPDEADGPFEVTEARRLLEGEVAALAASAASDQQIAELEAILARIGDMRSDQPTRERADRAFHVALARATGNDVLVGLVETLWDKRYQSPLCVYFFSRAREAGIQPPVDEHRLVLDAIRARDPDAARRAMRDHLARVTENLLIATEADVLDRARLRVEERRFDFARRAGVQV